MSVSNFLDKETDNAYFTLPVTSSIIQRTNASADPILQITQDADPATNAPITGDYTFQLKSGKEYVATVDFYIVCEPADVGDVNEVFQFALGWKESTDAAVNFNLLPVESVSSGAVGRGLWTKVSKTFTFTSNGTGVFQFALRPSFNGFQGGVTGNLNIIIPGTNAYGALNLQFAPFTMTLWT